MRELCLSYLKYTYPSTFCSPTPFRYNKAAVLAPFGSYLLHQPSLTFLIERLCGRNSEAAGEKGMILHWVLMKNYISSCLPRSSTHLCCTNKGVSSCKVSAPVPQRHPLAEKIRRGYHSFPTVMGQSKCKLWD